MEKDSKRHLENRKEENIARKKSILTVLFTSILRLSLAAALLIFLSVTAYADDVVVENGKVGIGDTSPGEKLQVNNGNIKIATAQNKLIFDNDLRYIQGVQTGGADYLTISEHSWALGIQLGFADASNPGGGYPFYPTMTIRSASGAAGSVAIGTAAPASSSRLTLKAVDFAGGSGFIRGIQAKTNEASFDIWHPQGDPDAVLSLYDDAEKEKVRLHAGGNSWFNSSNVGIGIVEPLRKLHVHSDDWASPSEIHASGDTSGFSFTDREKGRTWETPGQPGTRWVLYSWGRGASLWANDVGNRISFTEPYQRDKNKGWGAVWIAPQEVNNDNAVEGAEIFLSAPRKADGSVKSAEVAIDNNNGNFRVVMQDKAGGNWFVPIIATPSGTVGIGTQGPGAKLIVKAASGPTGGIRLQNSNDYGPVVNIYESGGDGAIDLYTGNNPTQLRTHISSYGNTYFNPNAGSVAIGTNTPAAGYKLDVEGKIQANAFDTGDITFTDQKTQQTLWRMFEDEDGLYLENSRNGKLYRFVLEEIKA